MANLAETKWKKLLSRSRLFCLIPFVDFVFVAGSMAMGTAEENSDFDVIVGCRKGRIFIVRFCCFIHFGLFGWRKKKEECGSLAKDKFCFSHFVTPESYRLSGPHNDYWKKLYQSIVPIYGSAEFIQKFYDANADWMGKRRIYKEDGRILLCQTGFIKKVREIILSGKFGDLIENILKKIQIKKIEKSLKTEESYKPRIIYGDGELELHPDTKRIEEFCEK